MAFEFIVFDRTFDQRDLDIMRHHEIGNVPGIGDDEMQVDPGYLR
jgi:hypothetical protein